MTGMMAKSAKGTGERLRRPYRAAYVESSSPLLHGEVRTPARGGKYFSRGRGAALDYYRREPLPYNTQASREPWMERDAREYASRRATADWGYREPYGSPGRGGSTDMRYGTAGRSGSPRHFSKDDPLADMRMNRHTNSAKSHAYESGYDDVYGGGSPREDNHHSHYGSPYGPSGNTSPRGRSFDGNYYTSPSAGGYGGLVASYVGGPSIHDIPSGFSSNNYVQPVAGPESGVLSENPRYYGASGRYSPTKFTSTELDVVPVRERRSHAY